MFKASGGFYNTRAFQRTLNQGHRMRRKKSTKWKLTCVQNSPSADDKSGFDPDISKWGFGQNIPTWFLSFTFQKMGLCHFSLHIIRLACRTILIFSLAWRASLGGPSRYLERDRKVHRKFSRGPWKKVFTSKMGVWSEYSSPILSSTFSKFQLFPLFLTYNPIGVSYGPDFFTGVKS